MQPGRGRRWTAGASGGAGRAIDPTGFRHPRGAGVPDTDPRPLAVCTWLRGRVGRLAVSSRRSEWTPRVLKSLRRTAGPSFPGPSAHLDRCVTAVLPGLVIRVGRGFTGHATRAARSGDAGAGRALDTHWARKPPEAGRDWTFAAVHPGSSAAPWLDGNAGCYLGSWSRILRRRPRRVPARRHARDPDREDVAFRLRTELPEGAGIRVVRVRPVDREAHTRQGRPTKMRVRFCLSGRSHADEGAQRLIGQFFAIRRVPPRAATLQADDTMTSRAVDGDRPRRMRGGSPGGC